MLAIGFGRVWTYHPLSTRKKVITNIFSLLLHHCVALISEMVNAPVFIFTSKGLNISNAPELFNCFLNLPFPHIAENNPVDLGWVHDHLNVETKIIDGDIIVCVMPFQMKIVMHIGTLH